VHEALNLFYVVQFDEIKINSPFNETTDTYFQNRTRYIHVDDKTRKGEQES